MARGPRPVPEATHEPARAVQRRGGDSVGGDVHAIASAGLAGSAGPLPFQAQIQHSFGHFDVSNVQAHTDSHAAEANRAMGSMAYATGHSVAFGGRPDLHTAAHEAAHIIQQRAGVSLAGGVGRAVDHYVRHADRVADAVVSGESAEHILGEMAGGGGANPVQRRAIQLRGEGAGRSATVAPASGGGGTPATTPATAAPATDAGAGAGPASDVAAVRARHPGGVPVALYLMPSAADRDAWTREMTGKSVEEAMRLAGPARSSARARRVFTAMREAQRTTTTEADAAGLAAAKFGNDLEFSRQAPRHAAARQSVAVGGGGLQMGQAMAYTRQEPDRWKENIKAVSDAVGPLSGGGGTPAAPAAGPAPAPAPAAGAGGAGPAQATRRGRGITANHRNINEIAIFTHGGQTGIDLGRWVGAGSVAGFLGTAVTPSVNVQLYACNAGADGGFAQQLAEQLSATTGGSANVFGHETAGHTTRNARGRTFRAEGGRVTVNATNYEAVFDAAFMAAETRRLAGELQVDAASLESVLPAVTRSWMAGPGNRVGIDVRGARATAGAAGERAEGGGRETAAQAIGVDFEGTVRAVRSAWQSAAASRVRGALQREGGDSPAAAGRRVRSRAADTT